MNAPALSLGDILQTALGLLAVLAVILAGAWLLRRLTGIRGNAQGPFQLLGTLALGTRERLVFMEVEGKRLLLGVSQGRIQTLYVFDEPSSPEEPS